MHLEIESISIRFLGQYESKVNTVFTSKHYYETEVPYQHTYEKRLLQLVTISLFQLLLTVEVSYKSYQSQIPTFTPTLLTIRTLFFTTFI